jgi:NitT/TauT family transport system substrate-binding protein
MKKLLATLMFAAAAGLAACGSETPFAQQAEAPKPAPAPAPKVERFDVAWSHYTGWEPWGYADHAGILKKWADKYGIEIQLTLVNDYVESINLYTAGKYHACAMTNMDALTIPGVGGIDSQAVIVGDFSNGNDGIVMKNGSKVTDLEGRSINLVELSVSHYLLARALDQNGMTEQDVKLVNTSDADIASLFTSDPNGAAVTWNPPLMQALKAPGANLVFDSSKIPGEIMDLMVVKTDAPDSLKKALAGAWFETIGLMAAGNPKSDEAIAFMANASGATVEEFRLQLGTTALFYEPAKAAEFAASAAVGETMDKVRSFSFAKNLLGHGAASADVVGIELDDGTVLGNKDNVKLRFTSKYMKMAADGTL